MRVQRTGKGYVLWEQASVPGMELAPVLWLSQVAWDRGPVPWDPRSCGQGHTGDEFGAGEVCCPVWGTQQQLCRWFRGIGDTDPSSPPQHEAHAHTHACWICRKECGWVEHHAWN